ncbi:hypothetical protein ABVK25_002840 [Lepraria finkii]|uniref:Uncharacterized protein n=1 Tax=Lepraria finkii TaxID=1340010 RepID=A0ABR4BGZ8_9LECA
MTTRDVEIPEPQLTTKTWPISCASLRLKPGREKDSLTFKEKLKSMRTCKLPTPTVGSSQHEPANYLERRPQYRRLFSSAASAGHSEEMLHIPTRMYTYSSHPQRNLQLT